MQKRVPVEVVSSPFELPTPPAKPAHPPYDNMGGNKATESGAKVISAEGLSTGRKPEEYYYRLGLDTLQVSVNGAWKNTDAPVELRARRERAERHRAVGIGMETLSSPDRKQLQVLPHGARPCYDILIRDADGLEVRALPRTTMPDFMVRFGARWCIENTVDDLEAWTVSLLRSLDFLPERVQLSEVHVRCDTPTRFVMGDLKKFRGTGMRNATLNPHCQPDGLTGIDNLGGSKAVTFSIYDKRREQKRKRGIMWPAIWESYGLDADAPVWRVEGRFKREALKQIGLDLLSDLNDRSIAGIWHRFTTKYLVLVSDSTKRTSRNTPARKWAKIQACGEKMDAQPVVSDATVSASMLAKQAAGCLASSLARTGLGYTDMVVEHVVNHALVQAEQDFAERRLELLSKQVIDSLEKAPLESFAGAQSLRQDIIHGIRKAGRSRICSRRYTEADPTRRIELLPMLRRRRMRLRFEFLTSAIPKTTILL